MPYVPAYEPRWLLAASLLWVCGTASGEGLEAIEAQGPSARAAEREPSAYAPRSAADRSDGDVAAPAAGEAADDNGARRLRRSRPNGSDSTTTHPAAERNAHLLSRLIQSSGTTALAALAFVVGLFMLLAWAVQRGMPRSSQVLPAEAIRVLGRIPLGARQFGHLLHVGNKLVLVSIQQSGVEKLAEIDEPQEVLRLLALCDRGRSGGSQREFEDIFGEFAKDRRAAGFLGGEAPVAGQRGPAGGDRHA